MKSGKKKLQQNQPLTAWFSLCLPARKETNFLQIQPIYPTQHRVFALQNTLM